MDDFDISKSHNIDTFYGTFKNTKTLYSVSYSTRNNV